MLYDLSPALTESYAVWPSDQPLKYKRALEVQRGHSVNITSLEATSHLGAHAVCSQMIETSDPSIGELALHPFLGMCQVLEIKVEPKALLTLDHLPKNFEAPRLLLKINPSFSEDQFNPDYPALDPSLFLFFKEKNIELLGLDTPGADLYKHCTKVLSQKEASRYKIPLLYNLRLDPVPEGLYELIALPLRLVGCEASPVRAILRTLDHE